MQIKVGLAVDRGVKSHREQIDANQKSQTSVGDTRSGDVWRLISLIVVWYCVFIATHLLVAINTVQEDTNVWKEADGEKAPSFLD